MCYNIDVLNTIYIFIQIRKITYKHFIECFYRKISSNYIAIKFRVLLFLFKSESSSKPTIEFKFHLMKREAGIVNIQIKLLLAKQRHCLFQIFLCYRFEKFSVFLLIDISLPLTRTSIFSLNSHVTDML